MLVQDNLTGYVHEVPDDQIYGYDDYDEYPDETVGEYPEEIGEEVYDGMGNPLGFSFLPKIFRGITNLFRRPSPSPPPVAPIPGIQFPGTFPSMQASGGIPPSWWRPPTIHWSWVNQFRPWRRPRFGLSMHWLRQPFSAASLSARRMAYMNWRQQQGMAPGMAPGMPPGMPFPGMPAGGMFPGMPPGGMMPGMIPGMVPGMPPGMMQPALPPGMPPGMVPGASPFAAGGARAGGRRRRGRRRRRR